MIRVTLESESEVLDLNEISTSNEGVEAVAGATGLGLPSLDVQWFEGAGDGARHRNTRALPRDLDLPLHVVVANRDALKAKLAPLVRIVAGKFVMKVYEGDSYVWAEFVRVGGGTYATGTDSDGETEWKSILTLRAGSPFWTHGDEQTVQVEGETTGTPHSLSFLNPGTASACPVFEIAGPLTDVTIEHNGDSLTWSGPLFGDESITIDTERGSVVDQDGGNRYGGLGLAPKMFKVAPERSDILVTLEDNGLATARKNWVTNPTFGLGTHDWTSATPSRVSVVDERLVVSGIDGFAQPTIASASKVLSGYAAQAGQVFQFRGTFYASRQGAEIKCRVVLAIDGEYFEYPIDAPTGVEIVRSFVVPTSGTMTVTVHSGRRYADPASLPAPGVDIQVDRLYVGLAGPYFDGSTPDTPDSGYAWDGADHASTSTWTYLSASNTPRFEMRLTPRDWMLV